MLIDFGALGLGFELDASLDLAVTLVRPLWWVNADTGGVSLDSSLSTEFNLALEGGLVPTAGDGIDIDLPQDLAGRKVLVSISGGANFGRHLETSASAASVARVSADFVIGFGLTRG